jgi:hypothetical protein
MAPGSDQVSKADLDEIRDIALATFAFLSAVAESPGVATSKPS